MSRPAILGGDPVCELRSRWPVWSEREAQLMTQALESGRWAGEGPLERELERRFAGLQTARHGLCVANGTLALQLAFEALDIGVGDEVVVPGLTWQSTAAAVLDVNATPVLVDVRADTLCIDPELVAAAITPRTKAIAAVHLYGALADLDAIAAIARDHGRAVVEDCAHAHGSRWRGRGAGSLGDIGAFSFQSSKTVTSGEGGFVTTSDDRLFERLHSLRNCGRRRPGSRDEDWQPVQSGNYRMTELQAALLVGQLERVAQQRRRRAASAAALDAALARIPGIAPQRCDERVTGRNLYAYVFRYDPAAFGGLSAGAVPAGARGGDRGRIRRALPAAGQLGAAPASDQAPPPPRRGVPGGDRPAALRAAGRAPRPRTLRRLLARGPARRAGAGARHRGCRRAHARARRDAARPGATRIGRGLTARRPRSRRVALTAIFFVNGAVLANWVPRIPDVQERLSLSEGALGVALLGVAAGALVAMPLAGRALGRIGSLRILAPAVLAYCAALPLLALAPGLATLTAALFVVGAANGTLDVAMNHEGVAIERDHERPILSAFHGAFSVGGLAGALCGGGFAAAGVAPLAHLATVAVLLGAIAAVALLRLRPGSPPGAGPASGPVIARPPR